MITYQNKILSFKDNKAIFIKIKIEGHDKPIHEYNMALSLDWSKKLLAHNKTPQLIIMEKFRNEGFRCEVCWTVDQFRLVVDNYFNNYAPGEL